jgi:hypothetical protein
LFDLSWKATHGNKQLFMSIHPPSLEQKRRKRRGPLTYIGTFCAICLGIYVIWFAIRFPEAQRQERAVLAIHALGGRVVPWVEIIGEPGYRKFLGVEFTGSNVTDDDLELLRPLNGPGDLDLTDTKVSDAGLPHLVGLKRLHSLELTGTKLTDAGLRTLGTIHELVGLDVQRTSITDSGLDHLKGLTNLSWLDLRDTKVTKAGLTKLQQALPNCKIHWDPPTSDEPKKPNVPDRLH